MRMSMMYRNAAFALLGFAALAIAPAHAAPATAVEVEEVVGESGVSAYLVESDAVPVVAIEFSFKGGVETDPQDKLGRANMAAALLDQGAGELEAQAFQQRLADLSISMSFNVGFDRFTGSLYTTRETLDEAVELLRLALAEPRFDEAPVERVRAAIVNDITRNVSEPGWLARRALYGELMPEHPYSRPSRGTIATLASLEADDLRDYVSEVFTRDNLTVAAAGDIGADELAGLVDEVFGDLPAEGTSHEIRDWQVPEGSARVLVDRAGAQSMLLMAQEGVSWRDEDYHAATIMNHVLGGGGFGSRLTEEVRARRGLTYGISSFLFNAENADMLMVQASLADPNVEPALGVVLAEWRRMRDAGITKEELEEAKRYLTGSFPLNLTSTRDIAGMLLVMQLRDYGSDYLARRNALIEAVTVEDVNRVAATLLDPDGLDYVVVGQPGEGVPFDLRLTAAELAARELAPSGMASGTD